MSTTDQQVLSWLQRKVAEPDSSGVSWPTGRWGLTEVLAYMNERQSRFLRDTAVYMGIPLESPVIAYATDVTFDQGILGPYRVTWLADDGTTAPIYPGSLFGLDMVDAGWPAHAEVRPRIYASQADVPVLKIRLGPPSFNNGRVRVLGTSIVSVLAGAGDILSIPDDYVPWYRYGVLADMLGKNGRAQDLPRASYCQQRFTEGVDVAKGRLEGRW